MRFMTLGRLSLILVIGLFLGLGAVVGQTQHGILLSWTETNNGDLAVGFNVYRGTVSGGPYTKVNTSQIPATTESYLDPLSSLVGGTKYFYVVRSVDSLGIESANSTEASAIAPGANPPGALTAQPQ